MKYLQHLYLPTQINILDFLLLSFKTILLVMIPKNNCIVLNRYEIVSFLSWIHIKEKGSNLKVILLFNLIWFSGYTLKSHFLEILSYNFKTVYINIIVFIRRKCIIRMKSTNLAK